MGVERGDVILKQALLKQFPFLYRLRIAQLRFYRHVNNILHQQRFARNYNQDNLPYRCKVHQSLLRRKLGVTDPILQENKITNLRISIEKIDGIIIKPGEVFSFWFLVGKTTAKRGYIEGLLLSQGHVTTGIGGGICQLANLLFWMALHTPLTIVERHHHSFDPFPDDGRVLPFGSGASLFYNYVDLRFHNPTDQPFQIRVWLTDQFLKGAIYTEKEWPLSYHIVEKNHHFLRKENKNYRENEIWRRSIDKRTGQLIKEELLIHNFSEVKYDPFTSLQAMQKGRF